MKVRKKEGNEKRRKNIKVNRKKGQKGRRNAIGKKTKEKRRKAERMK